MLPFSIPIPTWLKLLLKAVVTVLTFWLILQHVNLSEVWATWTDSNFALLPLSFLFFWAQAAILSYRWQLLTKLSYFQSYKVTTLGILANALLIASIGGMFARTALCVRYGLTLSRAIAATMADRLIGLAAMAALCFASLPLLAPYIEARYFWPVALITLGTVAAIIIAIMIMQKRGFIAVAPKQWPTITLISVIAQSIFFVFVYVIGHAIYPDLSFWAMMSIIPFATFASVLPISIGGWGVREGAYVFGLSLIGMPKEEAFLLSIQVGVIGILAIGIAALPTLFAGKPIQSHK